MAIEDAADRPKKLMGDEGTVEEHRLEDQIKLDTYNKGAAKSSPPYGMRIARLIPNGTISPGRNGPASRY